MGRLILSLMLLSGAAWADAVEEDAQPELTKAERRAAKKAARKAKMESPDRLEPALFPGLSYDSNRGIGFGVVGNVARFKPGFDPYKWRLSGTLWFNLDEGPDGNPEMTYTYDYVDLDMPGLAGGKVRLAARAWFRRQTDLGWFGLGNSSQETKPWKRIDQERYPDAWARARRFHGSDHIFPGVRAVARVALAGELELFGGGGLVWNWVSPYPGSKLEQDLAGGSGDATQAALVGAGRHGVLEGVFGVLADARDDEVDPRSGWAVEASVRGGPVLEEDTGYGGLNAHARLYLPVHPTRFTLATRVMGDMLFGEPPFYELGKFGGLKPEDGPAGQFSMRGPPNRRYHGKAKVFATIEARVRLVTIQALGQPATLGFNLFLDGGRVWSDLVPRPELDGQGLGLKGAVGGGLRLRFGTTFMVRGDIGWSPDGTAIYIDVDHIF